MITGDFFEKEQVNELEQKLVGFDLTSDTLGFNVGNYIENMTNIWYNYIEVYKIMSKKKKKQNLSNRIFAYIMLFLAVAFSLTTVLSFVLR